MNHVPFILYLQLPGLLARAACLARGLVEGSVPLAVAEGKVIRDAGWGVGVQQGQSLLQARRRCPGLLVVPLEQVEARSLSERLYETLATLSPTVEPAGPDAVYAVLQRGEETQAYAAVCSAFPGLEPRRGTGPSKLIAKTLAESGVPSFDQAPSRFLWPEDMAITGKLARLGLETVGLAEAVGEAALRYQFGPKVGSLLYRRAQGLDSDPVQALWPLPTVRVERRFDLEPLEDATCLDAHLVALARQVSEELGELRRFGRVVSLVVETERGTEEQAWRPPWPIQSVREVLGAARRLLALASPQAPVTALALTVAELEIPTAESLTLFASVGAESRRRLEAARRFVVARYGTKALTTLGKVPVALRDRRRELAREARRG